MEGVSCCGAQAAVEGVHRLLRSVWVGWRRYLLILSMSNQCRHNAQHCCRGIINCGVLEITSSTTIRRELAVENMHFWAKIFVVSA